jgi:hypothetical protein
MNNMPFNNKSSWGSLLLSCTILVMRVIAAFMIQQHYPKSQPKTTTATFVQCWEGGTEIYNATVKAEVSHPVGVHFETDYGSVTVVEGCLLTELIEKEKKKFE